MTRNNVPKLEIGAVYKRIITALVGTLLKMALDKTGVDESLLESFDKVEQCLFPASEPLEFYLGKGREIFSEEVSEAMLLKHKAYNRTKHLYRTKVSGDEFATPKGFE